MFLDFVAYKDCDEYGRSDRREVAPVGYGGGYLLQEDAIADESAAQAGAEGEVGATEASGVEASADAIESPADNGPPQAPDAARVDDGPASGASEQA